MRKDYLPRAIIIVCVAAVLIGAACKASDDGGARIGAKTAAVPQTAATPGDGVRRVNVTEMQSLMAKGEAVLIDVRDEASYRSGHIKGSLSIPRPELPKRLGELPKDKLIVFYCA